MSLPASLVVDANPILSTLIGGNSRRLFRSSSGIAFHTTEWTLSEVHNYIPLFARKVDADEGTLVQGLQILPLNIYPPSAYEEQLEEANRRIPDPKDVDLLALALTLNLPVWSNDKHFDPDTIGVPVYRTAMLLKLLDETQTGP